MKRIVAWLCSVCQRRVEADQLPKGLLCPGCGVVPAEGWQAVIRKVRG